MKKSISWIRKSILVMLLVSIPITVIASIGIVPPTFTIAQAASVTTIYLDPPTINGTEIGVNNNVTVNVMIRDAYQIRTWEAGLTFNATALECLEYKEGPFLKSAGSTLWKAGTIDNTAGVITNHGAGLFYLSKNKTGDGTLGYLTFKVKASGVSDLHLDDDVRVSWKINTEVRINIIDVYTVVLGATAHTVVTVSNSTGGFYDHTFSVQNKEVSFKAVTPYIMGLKEAGFSNVAIPKSLLNVTNLDKWKVRIDGTLLSTAERTVTENATHTFIYVEYSRGVHEVQITTRMTSVISTALSSTSITLESSVTISGNITREDYTGRPNVNVTIQSRPVGAPDEEWDTVDIVETDPNSNYTYSWMPETGGTHEVMASWEGDNETISDKSDALLLIALYVFEPEGVYIETNSTVAKSNSIELKTFNFSQPLKQVSFNITSPYGTTGYSNVTIPIALLPPSPTGWKVIINGTLLSDEEVSVKANSTHTFVYFTYSKGFNVVEITTRMSSTILMALSSDSIDLESSVTISGNITAEDLTARPNATVTIQYRLSSGDWTTLDTVETEPSGNYTYPWEPVSAEIYEVMASWEGDNETIGDKSDVQTLTVIENSTISIILSSANITFGSSVTINGEIDPLKPNMSVYIQYKPLGAPDWAWSPAGDDLTDQDGSYTFTWTVDDPIITPPGTYEVKATWEGYNITVYGKNYNIIRGAESEVLSLTAKWTSTISIALSSTEITKGKSVTISGNITTADNIVRANVTVTIQYKLSGENWTTLDTVETDENGNYTYSWKPETDGTYYIRASWEGDDITFGNETDVLTLTVKKAQGIPLEIVIVAVVAIIVIAAVAVYFVKFRKP